jgi:ankyrin repeat protein
LSPIDLYAIHERVLLNIDGSLERRYAHHIFQWIRASSRPLYVAELAEVFAFDFDAETSGIPKYSPSSRPADPEAAILSECSTLVSIVKVDGRKVVKFSQQSVREYLTSDRIGQSARLSAFQIRLGEAHTVLGKACLSVLLQLDGPIDSKKIRDFPLASYAAEYWVDHARFEGVASGIQDAMYCLFDKSKPHLATWNCLYDVEKSQPRQSLFCHSTQLSAGPLYYAALCGFCDFGKRLLDSQGEDVNARGGYYKTPLYAALEKGHRDFALFLLDSGANVSSLGRGNRTALYVASSRGYADVVRTLISRGADPNIACDDWDEKGNDVKWTPLLVASKKGEVAVASELLKSRDSKKRADVNYRDNFGKSALYLASRHYSEELVGILLKHGATLDARDDRGRHALHEASDFGRVKVVELLLSKRGVKVDARSKWGSTPLHRAAKAGHLDVVQLLLNKRANPNAQDDHDCWSALHLAAGEGHVKIVEVLLKHRANTQARTDLGETPLQLASDNNHTEIMRLLSEKAGIRFARPVSLVSVTRPDSPRPRNRTISTT